MAVEPAAATGGRGGRSPALLLPVTLLLGLLSLAQVHHGVAVAGGIWQAFPSWDAPETHAWEAAAGLTAPSTDPTREASEQALAVGRPLGRLPLWEGPGPLESLALSSRLSRSPPRA
ncbi:MAG: hypothetical protein HYV61_01070 [Candidatus Rokubacteria bacterium]|nr:hypothetical protein [Candidatus Rokubacteria bacterium]